MAPSSCNRCGQPSGPHHFCAGEAEALLGRTLDGRYRIESVLGAGGMGTVYRAVQTSVQREVAIKTLHPQLAVAPAFFERFRREAETVSRLKHPHVVTLFDFGRAEDGTCYLVMEYLPGESLKERVKREGPLPLRESVRIIEQAAKGLAHAHEHECIHRDLKPHNLMLVRIDGADFIKVLDFGLVKAAEQDGEEKLTSTGQVLGTPQYMPPEQAGGEQVDERSDLYSLGGVLHYCLTGSSPFGANTIRKALTAALTQPVPRVESKRMGAPVPESVEAFLQRCLSPEPDDRPASAEAFVEELRAALEGVPDAVLDAVPEGARPRASAPASEIQRTISARAAAKSRSGAPSRHNEVSASLDERSGSGATKPSGRGEPSKHTLQYGRPTQPEIPSLKLAAATLAPPPPRKKFPLWAAVGVGGIAIAAAVGVVASKGVAAVAPPPAQVTEVPQPAAVVPPEPTLTGPSERVSVKLSSIPDQADVFAGGVQIGQTPIDVTLPRNEAHVLTFQRAGHERAERTIDLRFLTGDSTSVEVRLTPVKEAVKDPVKPRPKPREIPVFE